jgi:membrane-bound serine protease (ClpP class)
VHGERWRASAAAQLAAGQPVRVTARRGLTLVVEPNETPAEAAREDRP